MDDGDHFLLLQSKGFPAQWEGALRQAFQSVPGMTVVFDSAENASHSSDHKHFKHFLSVAAMHDHKHLGLFTGRIHTAKDTVLEPKNVEFLCRCTKSLVAHTDNFVNSVANATKL